jgi:Spy/CpxP family protein refolding chaperone
MAKSKIWLIVVVALLLANSLVLGMLWFNKKPKPPMAGGSAKEFLIKELNLTTSQQKQFDALREKHQENVKEAMDGMRELKDSFFEKISQPNVDSASLKDVLNLMSAKEQQRDLAAFYHFRELRKLLTGEQQQKFDKIIKDVTRMMNQPGPKGPPGGRKDGTPDHEGPPPR